MSSPSRAFTICRCGPRSNWSLACCALAASSSSSDSTVRTTLIDYAAGCIALPISWTIRLFNGEEVSAPIKEPQETLREIRDARNTLLPGGEFRRRLFFRYSFIWRKS